MLKRESVVLGDRTLVLSQANIVMGVRFEDLQRWARMENARELATVVGDETNDVDMTRATTSAARQYVREVLYPRLIASVVEGKEPTFEEILELSETEINEWFRACRRLNPHWFPAPVEEDGEKGGPTSTSGSSD